MLKFWCHRPSMAVKPSPGSSLFSKTACKGRRVLKKWQSPHIVTCSFWKRGYNLRLRQQKRGVILTLPILDTLQKMTNSLLVSRYSHWYQKTKGLKYPCKIDLENGGWYWPNNDIVTDTQLAGTLGYHGGSNPTWTRNRLAERQNCVGCTLWQINIAIENGHWNSGFAH